VDSQQITGIILAGGKSSRFASGDKTFALLNNRSFLENIVLTLQDHVCMLIISVDSQNKLDKLKTKIFDLEEKQFKVPIVFSIDNQLSSLEGPLNGYGSSLRLVETEFVLSLPVDMPLITPQIIEILKHQMGLSNSEIATFRIRKDLVTFLFHLANTDVMRSSFEYLIKYKLNRVSSLYRLLTRISLVEVEEEGCLVNINTIDDQEGLNDYLGRLDFIDRFDIEQNNSHYINFLETINASKKMKYLELELSNCKIVRIRQHILKDLELC
jgi:molybdopterin-guanine dinucleotide biosynthesis protein A